MSERSIEGYAISTQLFTVKLRSRHCRDLEEQNYGSHLI